MSASREWRHERRWPGAGIGIVFRRQLRGRSFRRDLFWAGLIAIALPALAALLQEAWPQRDEAGDLRAALLQRWMTTTLLCAVPIFHIAAAVQGASSIPTAEESDSTQAALLTHLRSYEIVAGRMLAALRPVIPALALSCGFWLIVGGDFKAVLLAHLALLSGLFMTGAAGSLFATRRRPGRAWGRGAGCALIWVTICTTAILLLNPLVRRMDDPVRLIEGTLLVNPVSAVSTSLKLDLLRMSWLYSRTDAPGYEFDYPPPIESVALFVCFGIVVQGLAAVRLGRAYRR